MDAGTSGWNGGGRNSGCDVSGWSGGGEIPDVMCLDGVAAEEFRMRCVQMEWRQRNSGCDMSGWNECGYE